VRAQQRQILADQRAERKAEAERKRAEAESMRDRLEDSEDNLKLRSRSRGMQVVNRGMSTGNDAMQSIGNRLADGTDSAELQKIGDQMAQKQATLGAQNVAILKMVLAELSKSAQETEIIKAQIKNIARKPGR
jgi:hypothetical protein